MATLRRKTIATGRFLQNIGEIADMTLARGRPIVKDIFHAVLTRERAVGNDE